MSRRERITCDCCGKEIKRGITVAADSITESLSTGQVLVFREEDFCSPACLVKALMNEDHWGLEE